MSRSLAAALAALPCALLTTACGSSAFPAKRDLPPEQMLEVPPRPVLAPAGATDNEMAAERVRFGAAYILLEGRFKDLVCYVIEKPAPCHPAPQAGK